MKSIEGAVALVKSMQEGTYGQPKATTTPAKPTKKKSILDEEFKLEISEKNVEMPKKPEAAKKAEAKKKPEDPKKAEAAKVSRSPESSSYKQDSKQFNIPRNSKIKVKTFSDAVDYIMKLSDEEALAHKEAGSYVTVSEKTPKFILDHVRDAKDLEMVIRFDSFYLATMESGAIDGHYHNYGETMKKILEIVSDPLAIVRMNDGRINILSDVHGSKGNHSIVSIEMNADKNIDGKFDKYNMIISVIPAKDTYMRNNLLNRGVAVEYEKNDLSQVNSQLHEWLAIVNDRSSKESVSHSPEKVNTKKQETEKKSSEPKKEAPEEISAVEDRLRGKKYAGTTFTAEEINAARADFKYLDALSPKVRSDILIMRRSAKEAKIDAQKVKGLTRLMAAYKFGATFSSKIKSNGFWRHGKNLLVINPNDIYQTTFGHELSHRVEDYKGYDAFASAVESLVGKARLDSEMKKYLADYNAAAEANGWKKWDAETNAEDLRHEAVANIIGKYLSNAEYIDKLANADRNFVYRIYRSIKGMKRDLALAEQISTEADTSSITEYRTIRRMEKVFETALGLTEKETNGRTISYSIQENNGIKYVLVSQNSINILEAEKGDSLQAKVRNYLRKYRGVVLPLGSTDNAYIRREGINEYTNPAKRLEDKDFISKLHAASEFSDLLKSGEFIGHEDDNGRHPDAVRGWNKYRLHFLVPTNEGKFSAYRGEIKIKLIARGDCFYDITKIENITDGTDGQALIKAAISADDVSKISIPDSVEKINPSDENSEKISRSVS